MKYKESLPRDVRELCAAHVRGYERRLEELSRKREAVYGSGRPEKAAGELEALDKSGDSRSVQAVEAALLLACHGIRSRTVCEHLRRGLVRNLCNRRLWPYERLNLPGIGKKEFYRRKQDFLVALAEELAYL